MNKNPIHSPHTAVSKVPEPMMIQLGYGVAGTVDSEAVSVARPTLARQKRRAGGLPSGPATGSLKIRCSIPDAIRPKVILYIFEDACAKQERVRLIVLTNARGPLFSRVLSVALQSWLGLPG